MTIRFNPIYIRMSFLKLLKSSIFILALSANACQSSEQEQTQGSVTDQSTVPAVDSAAQTERRPAPDFHRIPTENAQDRVYVCDDAHADVFHTEYNCELLNGCQTVKKNVTLIRAVEDYGRYNCDICSKDMAIIFDEKQVIQRR
ncbi:hypothetical protein ACMA1I_13035 [Pontibacter sp. 13R65]|uniref:hypothetical protein n=1 Tax=Pontibacter sp. 13R65 TaxID=3127458 RepID=UPI00301E4115